MMARRPGKYEPRWNKCRVGVWKDGPSGVEVDVTQAALDYRHHLEKVMKTINKGWFDDVAERNSAAVEKLAGRKPSMFAANNVTKAADLDGAVTTTLEEAQAGALNVRPNTWSGEGIHHMLTELRRRRLRAFGEDGAAVHEIHKAASAADLRAFRARENKEHPKCPVCKQRVKVVQGEYEGHMDRYGHACPHGGEKVPRQSYKAVGGPTGMKTLAQGWETIEKAAGGPRSTDHRGPGGMYEYNPGHITSISRGGTIGDYSGQKANYHDVSLGHGYEHNNHVIGSVIQTSKRNDEWTHSHVHGNILASPGTTFGHRQGAVDALKAEHYAHHYAAQKRPYNWRPD